MLETQLLEQLCATIATWRVLIGKGVSSHSPLTYRYQIRNGMSDLDWNGRFDQVTLNRVEIRFFKWNLQFNHFKYKKFQIGVGEG